MSELRVPGGKEDLAGLRAVLTRSFEFSDWDPFEHRVGVENFRLLGAPGSGAVAAGLALYPMGIWFGGASIPLGGVAAVGVAPEHRGTGVGAALMGGLVRELHAGGTPLAALYASTQTLYRKVGFEQAGVRVRYRVAPDRIGIVDRRVPVRAIDPGDHRAFHAMYRRFAERQNGVLDRGRILWERTTAPFNTTTHAAVFGPEDAPEGYVVYNQPKGEHPPRYELSVRDVVAHTPAAARRIWTYFGDHRSLATAVEWSGPTADPLQIHLPEIPIEVASLDRWLLRICHVRRALALRGYAADASGELHLEVADEVAAENAGRCVLAVAGGRAEVHDGGRGELRLHVRALAPLYAGLFTATELAAFGMADGSLATLAMADRVFRGPSPWMPDFF